MMEELERRALFNQPLQESSIQKIFPEVKATSAVAVYGYWKEKRRRRTERRQNDKVFQPLKSQNAGAKKANKIKVGKRRVKLNVASSPTRGKVCTRSSDLVSSKSHTAETKEVGTLTSFLPSSKRQNQEAKLMLGNDGNAHAAGQKPLSFPCQVAALCKASFLLEDPKTGLIFKADAIKRAQKFLSWTSGGLGAFSDPQGLPEIRKEVADFITRRDGYPSEQNQIFLTDGISRGLLFILNMIIKDAEDGILVPLPQYPLCTAVVESLGGTTVGYFLDLNMGLDLQNLRHSLEYARSKKVKVRALLIINPGNPTGQCMSEDELKIVIAFCSKEKLILLADEVNQQVIPAENLFTSAKEALMGMGAPFDKDVSLVSFHSISQEYMGETFQRGGYLELTNAEPSVLNYLREAASSSPPNITGQFLLSIMLNPPMHGDASYDDFVRESQKNRESMCARAVMMAKIFNTCRNCSCEVKEGAIYSFPRIQLPPKAIMAAKEANSDVGHFYYKRLHEETGISTFYSAWGRKKGSFHLIPSTIPEVEVIKILMGRFKNFNDRFMAEYQD